MKRTFTSNCSGLQRVRANRVVAVVLAILACLAVQGQSRYADSLKRAYLVAGTDTEKVHTLNLLNKACRLKGLYGEALHYARGAARLSDALGFKKGSAVAYNNYGLTQFLIGNYAEALKGYFASLQIREVLRDAKGMGRLYGNIGTVYQTQGDYPKALDYFAKALQQDEQSGYKRGTAITLGNIGSIHSLRGEHDKALDYYRRALDLCREIGFREGEANALGNIGLAFDKKGEQEQALQYYRQALQLDEEMKNLSGVSVHLGNMAAHYLARGDHRQAEAAVRHALELSYAQGSLEGISEGEETYSRICEARGLYKEALAHYRKFIAARDSISNEANTRAQTRLEMNYEFEKKEAATRLGQEKRDALAQADRRRQNIILLAVSGFGLLVLGFAIFAWRSFLQKKKANIEISRQKQVIEEKQKEILDSIHYARRIQASLMPNERYVDKVLRGMRI
jgi:tetratricopeptide (TPR) repeat protein